ncbi:hypothetical protein KIH79_06990 [Bifidobacterium sp. 82T10]|uniref:Uncharacterized protein n=1 Tax=Bifidobacterium miconis TaxID=2834435 RepID=A0ABS6WF71_9BIFI|nr:hypothetical protein [Bifidobacterium miconis]MBW3092696.1 hypothetical protein [Bifidobacterium miconis]
MGNRLQSRSRCMVAGAVLLVAAIVLCVFAHFAAAAMTVAVAAVTALCSLRECRICHRFAVLSRTADYGPICPVCQRLIAEGRQQELLERRM